MQNDLLNIRINTVYKSIRDYTSILRVDHWHKNLFLLPGWLAGLKFFDVSVNLTVVSDFAVTLFFTALVSSINYAINEILDCETDKHHPIKRLRALPSGRLQITTAWYYTIIFTLLVSTFAISLLRIEVIILLIIFFLSGLVYNLPPIRAKDKAFFDVIVESFNNPIRLLLGWYSLKASNAFVPSTLIVAFWSIGAFLMTAKRYAEFRFLNINIEARTLYRKSFSVYSEEKLLLAMILYISLFNLSFGIIVQKYSPDLLMLLPFILIFITWFFKLSFEEDSIIKDPEKIIMKRGFLLYSIFCLIILILSLFGPENLKMISQFILN